MKHCGSRITLIKRGELYAAIKANYLAVISTGEPTYRPVDLRTFPYILDFGIIKGISIRKLKAEFSYDFVNDH